MKKTFNIFGIIILTCIITSALISCSSPTLTPIDEINESTATHIVNKQTGNYPEVTQDENGNYPKPTRNMQNVPILPQSTLGEIWEIIVTVDNKSVNTYCSIVEGKQVSAEICIENAQQNLVDVSPNCKISISTSKGLADFEVYSLTDGSIQQVNDGIILAPQKPGVVLYMAIAVLNGQVATYTFAVNVI